jgi:DNA polymerase elongation subunit (family B)
MDFPRKSAPPLETSKSFEFQITDWYIPEADRATDYYNRLEGYPSNTDDKLPLYEMFMYGVTEDGHSVTCQLHGFEPYFFLKLPSDWDPLNEREKLRELRNMLLTEKVQKKKYNRNTKSYDNYNATVIPYRMKDHLSYMKIVKRKDYWGFTNREDFSFIKIRVKSQSLFNILKRWFSENKWKLYGSNLDPFLRYIHEKKIQPCGWVSLPAEAYTLVDENDIQTRTSYNIKINANEVEACDYKKIAPLMIASFDIECMSSHGDFPVAKKNYRKLATDLVSALAVFREQFDEGILRTWLMTVFKEDIKIANGKAIISRVFPKTKAVDLSRFITDKFIEETFKMLQNHKPEEMTDPDAEAEADADDETVNITIADEKLIKHLSDKLPELKGDAIIQIGTTVSIFGSKEILYKHIVCLKETDQIDGIDVEWYDNEKDLLFAWKDFIQRLDPDVITGYNIFGFDMKYIWERVEELGEIDEFCVGLGRINNRRSFLDKKELSSSALGMNIMHFFDMDGVVQIDVFKVMQRDHKLESNKLDFVAATFLGDKKDDLKPKEIFERFRGNSFDRAIIAKYCIQDCALCNRLLDKLKVIGNNIGMGNVCFVPLSYLFMRGQGIKIFSLVSRECHLKHYLIPVIKDVSDADEADGYEGAIVLEPECDMYLDDPITVFDYSSLYPSSMISRNLSHDSFVNDPKYANLENKGITYQTIEYDVYEGKGDKKHSVGKKQCVFAQFPNGEKGILPTILMDLLKNRKLTRLKIEYETLLLDDNTEITGCVSEKESVFIVRDADTGVITEVAKERVISRKDTYTDFEQAVLDALQLAYKITANSLYGQTGSRFSSIFLKEIAACTTATGREMIHLAKDFMEKEYGARIIYGDTDSIFCKFPLDVPQEQRLQKAIELGIQAEKAVKAVLPAYQSLAYEKVLYPLILLSKKRYIGNLYEKDPTKFKQKEMGVVLKRRDNAPIVKIVYGGIIKILMNEKNLDASVEFLWKHLQDIVDGKVSLENYIISKTLKSNYKDPTKIAHKVLADRMGERDAGNQPMVNDRVPFIFIKSADGNIPKLQGDRIEHPDYIREKNLQADGNHYITNQLMKPICQLYALCLDKLPNYTFADNYWVQIDEELSYKDLYKNDKKRADRIQALKMKEVENLLFSKFLELPKKKISSGKNKVSASASASASGKWFQLRIESTDIKRGKEYSITGILSDEIGLELWRETYKIKANKLFTLIIGTEKILGYINEKHLDVKNLVITSEKTFIYEWKRAIKQPLDTLKADFDKATLEGDVEKVEELQKYRSFINIIELCEDMAYKFQNIS